MSQSKAKKLLIADSNRLIRLALEVLFEKEGDIEIVGEANSAEELKRMLIGIGADVVLIDFTSREFSIDIIPECHKIKPEVRFVAITPDQSGSTLVNALRAGVTSYVKKDCDFNEIVSSVRETSRGGTFFCGQVLDTIRRESIDLDDLEDAAYNCDPVMLSAREKEIIRLVAEGLTNGQIAERLFLSPHTITTHRKNIMQKLGVNNTASIVLYAVKSNLINTNKFFFNPPAEREMN